MPVTSGHADAPRQRRRLWIYTRAQAHSPRNRVLMRCDRRWAPGTGIEKSMRAAPVPPSPRPSLTAPRPVPLRPHDPWCVSPLERPGSTRPSSARRRAPVSPPSGSVTPALLSVSLALCRGRRPTRVLRAVVALCLVAGRRAQRPRIDAPHRACPVRVLVPYWLPVVGCPVVRRRSGEGLHWSARTCAPPRPARYAITRGIGRYRAQ